MPPNALSHPSEITREVLRLLVARKLLPTPDNFTRLYHELAGTEAPEGAEYPFDLIREIAGYLPRDTATREERAKSLRNALEAHDAEATHAALLAALEFLQPEHGPAWNTLIGQLIREWERRHSGWTTAQKRDALERVLTSQAPEALHARLQGLLRAWHSAPDNPEATLIDGPAILGDPQMEMAAEIDNARAEASPKTAEPRMLAPGEAGESIGHLRELLVISLELVAPAFLADYPHLLRETQRFSDWVREAGSARDLQRLIEPLRKFAYRLEIAAGDQAEVHAGELRLLRLLLENIDEILLDAPWLQGQIEVLRELLGQPPHPRLIDDAERRLRDIIVRQSQLKHTLAEAHTRLRTLLARFIDQLAELADTTGDYHARISAHAERIGAAHDIAEISQELDDLLRDTRELSEQTRSAHQRMNEAHGQTRAAESRVAELERQLEETSRELRHDARTGALNRRGLEESFVKESARAARRGATPCLARLDIDDFDAHVEALGAQGRDQALHHFAAVIRRHLPVTDTLARLEGGAFAILQPESPPEEAVVTLRRLLRELTREFFLDKEHKLLVTFSAGVTLWQTDEELDAVLARAGQALAKARAEGKNRVSLHTNPQPDNDARAQSPG